MGFYLQAVSYNGSLSIEQDFGRDEKRGSPALEGGVWRAHCWFES